MRIHVKKIVNPVNDSEYVLFFEGDEQRPIAILTPLELQMLLDQINDAIEAKPNG